MTRYYRKAAAVEAVQWTGGNEDEVLDVAGHGHFQVLDQDDRALSDDPDCTASLLESAHSTWRGMLPGQWVIRDDRGGLRAYRDAEFREKYEPAPDDLVIP